ncbi:MAG TPA: hypothetical protein VHG72_01535 [Polyangia bacterium]|nr:hypothetical protein [Polyangia bacterium]
MRTSGASIRSGAALAFVLLAAGPVIAAEPPPPGDAFIAHLLRLGLGPEAGTEARRLMLENGPDAVAPETAYRVGMQLALDGRADQAVPFLDQAAAATTDPTRADQLSLATGVVLLRANAFPHAVHVFARVEAFGADAPTRAFATRLRCIAEVMARDGAAARACIQEMPPGTAPPPVELDDLLRALEVSARTRAIQGGLLSALLPGLGQATGGNPGDGLLAFAVNGAFGTAVGLLIAEGAIADASLLGLGVGLRYYLGNIYNGAQAWRGAAERRRGEASRRLIRILGATR